MAQRLQWSRFFVLRRWRPMRERSSHSPQTRLAYGLAMRPAWDLKAGRRRILATTATASHHGTQQEALLGLLGWNCDRPRVRAGGSRRTRRSNAAARFPGSGETARMRTSAGPLTQAHGAQATTLQALG